MDAAQGVIVEPCPSANLGSRAVPRIATADSEQCEKPIAFQKIKQLRTDRNVRLLQWAAGLGALCCTLLVTCEKRLWSVDYDRTAAVLYSCCICSDDVSRVLTSGTSAPIFIILFRTNCHQSEFSYVVLNRGG